MTSAPAGATPSSALPRDPWERFGWLIWSGWLIFLAFPITASVVADRPWQVRALGVLLTLLFAVVYVWEVLRLSRPGRRVVIGRVPEPVLVLGVLAVIAVAATWPVGLNALSFVPFLQSFGVFALTRPWCWWYATLVMGATTLVTTVLLGMEELTLVFILFGVTAASVAGRLLGETSDAYEDARLGRTVAEERERVARDVHDVLGHSLTVLSVKAELANRLIDVDPERARSELADISRLSREALAEVRSTVGGLRAARLDDEITGARTALADQGIAATLPDDVRETDPRYRPVMGWVLREAVTNVLRHSRATRCDVTLGHSSLVVVDDGRGLDGTREGNGLRGLRERVESAGGHFDVGPGPAGGTRLEVRW